MANERRLIDMDETIKQLRDYADRKHENGHNDTANGILKAVSYIRNNMTRVDAVEVIHCKDCKYWEPISYGHRTDGICLCLHKYHDAARPGTEGDFYCAYSKRKSGTQPQKEDVRSTERGQW